MKKLILAASFLTSPVFSQALDENPLENPDAPGPMTLQEQYEYQTQTFEKIMTELRTNEVFAGRMTEVKFRGAQYAIDRTMEAVAKKVPGTPPRAPGLGTLLNDLGVTARGQIRIKVIQREFENGKIKNEEIWEIDVGGMWEAETGMTDAAGKSHK